MKGKCYSQESKKGTDNGTYKVKQVGVKYAGNGAGVPLMAHSTDRVLTLSEEEWGK
jgi:hypothetical protein